VSKTYLYFATKTGQNYIHTCMSCTWISGLSRRAFDVSISLSKVCLGPKDNLRRHSSNSSGVIRREESITEAKKAKHKWAIPVIIHSKMSRPISHKVKVLQQNISSIINSESIFGAQIISLARQLWCQPPKFWRENSWLGRMSHVRCSTQRN